MSAATISSKTSKTPGTLWKNRVFATLFSAYAVASFGEWFDAFAIEILVAFRWHTDPLLIALIPVMMALPGILLGSLAGVAADRWRKVQLMLLADAIETVLTVLILFVPSIYWLLPLIALRSAMGVFRVPAQQSLTRQVVTEDQLLRATSYNGMVNQFSKIAGPLLGAVALTVISPQWCILVNALTRLLSCVLLFRLRHIEGEEGVPGGRPKDTVERTANEGDKPNFAAMWKQGWTVLLRRRILLATFTVNVAVLLAIQMVNFQFPTLYREIAPHNESLLGWMVSATGVGAVITMLALNRLGNLRYGWGIGSGIALVGAAVGCMGLLTSDSPEIWSVILGLVIGIGNGLFFVTNNYALQKETPEGMIGRIFGIRNMSASLIMVVSPLLGGTLIRELGVGRVFLYMGILVLAIGVICLLVQRIFWPSGRNSVQSADGRQVSG